MRDAEVYRIINQNNAQIGQVLNQMRMEVVTLQAALISEVLRNQAMEEVITTVTVGSTTTPLVSKEAVEAIFKAKLEDYEKKIEARKQANVAAAAAAAVNPAPPASSVIVAPTDAEVAQVVGTTPNA